MDDREDSFTKQLRALNNIADEGLAEMEQRLTRLETAWLPTALPLLSQTKDTTALGCDRQRLDLIKRRVDRLEQVSYQYEKGK